jgi:hypothetical protein
MGTPLSSLPQPRIPVKNREQAVIQGVLLGYEFGEEAPGVADGATINAP